MSNPTITPLTQGAHHIGLTVPDLSASRAFFIDTLGYTQLGEVPDYPAVFLSDGVLMITLWQTTDPTAANNFDRKNNIGLHHLALTVNGSAELAKLHEKLKTTAGVTIEFAPEPLGQGNTQHLMCTIPGGIRVEFIAPAA